MGQIGIDVSHNNGVLDWERIQKQGIAFAIIRVGYGNDEETQDDGQAVRNMQECERFGIPYGVYLYSYALNESDAISEAQHALRMVQGYNPRLGIWYDMEDADGYKSNHGFNVYEDGKELTQFCCIFCAQMKDRGYRTGVYACKDYFDRVLDSEQLAEYDKWVAHWEVTEPGMECLIWQYTAKGRVDGSSEQTDMNRFYENLPL